MRPIRTAPAFALLLGLAASAHTGVDGGLHHGFLTGFMHSADRREPSGGGLA